MTDRSIRHELRNIETLNETFIERYIIEKCLLPPRRVLISITMELIALISCNLDLQILADIKTTLLSQKA